MGGDDAFREVGVDFGDAETCGDRREGCGDEGEAHVVGF